MRNAGAKSRTIWQIFSCEGERAGRLLGGGFSEKRNQMPFIGWR
jgi:hypothetical protein